MPVETKREDIDDTAYVLIGSAKVMLTARSVGAKSFNVVAQEVGLSQPSPSTIDRATGDGSFKYVGEVADFWAIAETGNVKLEVIRS